MAIIIDAHHHYWHHDVVREHAWRGKDQSLLDRDFLPTDLQSELTTAGVTATVLVQSADTAAENDRMHAFAEETGTVTAVIGYLPVHDPAAARAELARADLSWWCGFRCLVADDPLEWLARPDVIALLSELADRGLAWDVVTLSSTQAAAVAAVVQAVPNLRVVVDHLARPPLSDAEAVEWRDRIAALAACPSIALKISVGVDVLRTWEQWDDTVLRESFREALTQFGPDRLMLASNWPVSLLGISYAALWQRYEELLPRFLGPEDVLRVQGGTAVDWYRLNIAAQQ